MGGLGDRGEGSPAVIPFSDGCGVVAAIGAGVSNVAVGDRVSTVHSPDWVSGPPTPEKGAVELGGPEAPGAGRELALLPEGAVIRAPEYLSDDEVATLACASLTAWRALFYDAHLRPGDTVVLQGTGGVSIFGLQFAVAAGLRTIVTSSSDDKLERARALGADVLINYVQTPKWGRAVREATGGRGADFILEVGGAGTLDQSFKAIRMGGHIAIVGAVATLAEPAQIAPHTFLRTAARVQGLVVGSREMFEQQLRAMTRSQIHPVVDRVFSWHDLRGALDFFDSGSHFGKVVIRFD